MVVVENDMLQSFILLHYICLMAFFPGQPG